MRLNEFVDDKKRSLYVSRKILNGKELKKWAKEQGFETCIPPEEMHITIIHSKKKVDCSKCFPKENNVEVEFEKEHPRFIKKFGEKKDTVVLVFHSKELALRHKYFTDEIGCVSDYSFQAHISITYNGKDIDIAGMQPFEGTLEFGPEIFDEIGEGFANTFTEKVL